MNGSPSPPSPAPAPATVDPAPPSGLSAWLAPVAAVARRPGLWPTAAIQLRRLVPRRWWRRRPFLPVPDRGWIRHRATVSTGDPAAVPTADEVVAWLRWCRDGSRRSRP